jgi:hypothetical protein
VRGGALAVGQSAAASEPINGERPVNIPAES